MRTADILGLSLSALWQQKLRTILTTLGVVFGSFALAASLSIGQGVQDTIDRESHRTDFLRRVDVHPQWRSTESDLPAEAIQVQGEMSDAKRQRIRQAIIAYKLRYSQEGPRVGLTQERLAMLGGLNHVEAVVPLVQGYGHAILDDQAQVTEVASARPEDTHARQRLLAGRFFNAPDERAVVVSEFLLYRCGLTDDAAGARVLGKKLRLEFRGVRNEPGIRLFLSKAAGEETSREELAALDKIRNQLPGALDQLDLTEAEKDALRKAVQDKPRPAEVYSEEFTIVGVVRMPTVDEQKAPWDPLRAEADVLVPVQTASDLFFRVPGQREYGVHHAVLIVDRAENVKDVVRQVRQAGLQGHSPVEYIERERLIYLMIFGGMTLVAGVAMLVAALGIANTMLMSVLERSREIGVMKAVGAANGQLQFIFLLEGALIGLFGGGLGLLLSWAASFPADAWVRSMVSRDLEFELKEAIFVFPLWLLLAVMLFAMLITTLAAVYPARRAAKVDPIAALRHE